MEIKLQDGYIISSDARQYILQQEKMIETGKTKGEMSITNLGYYPKIERVLIAYKERVIRTSDITTVEQLLKLMQELDDYIKSILKNN